MNRYVELGMKWISMILGYSSTLAHVGNENSGRYPRGSGEQPYQHTGKQLKNGGVIKWAPDVVEKSIKTGSVKLDVNPQLQKDHLESAHEEGKGYIVGGIEEARKLIDDLHGTGEPVKDAKGNWARKERVTANGSPAINENGKPTGSLMIHYSKTGTHIMTRKDDEK